jgi:hypothetical protein
VNHLIGRIVVHLDLFEHDFLFFREFRRGEDRVQEHIGEHVDRERNVMVDHLSVIAGRFLIGKGVEVTTHPIHRLRDLARAPPLRSLEEHVFDQMRDAALFPRFGGATDVGPNSERSRADVCHGFGNDANPVRQSRLTIQ